jgi:hypothetical protein
MPRFGQLKMGTCTVCNTQMEVLPADFEDQSGLKGHFCKKDFWEAVQNRSSIPKKEKKSNGNGTESQQEPATAER